MCRTFGADLRRMLPVSGSHSSAEDDWLRCYPCADRFVSSFTFHCSTASPILIFISLSTTASSSLFIIKVFVKDLYKSEVVMAIARIR